MDGSPQNEQQLSRMNLAHLIDDHPADDVALISRNRITTYGQLRERTAALRGAFASLGIGRGDRVLIACGNDHRFVKAYLATIGIGAVAVPVNPTSPAVELGRSLVTVEPSVVVLDVVAAAAWAGLAGSNGTTPGITDAMRTALAGVRTVVVTQADVIERAHLARDAGPRVAVFDELLSADPVDIVDVDADDTAAMLFTSGTAGAPRAAMLSHRNLRSNIDQALSSPDHTRSSDVVYGVLPMFHIFGLNVLLGVTLAAGAALVLVQRFDPAMAAETVVARKVTIIPGAPPMWVAFAHFDDLAPDTFASVRTAVSGAARLPVSVAERIEERFGLTIAEGYGLTETAPVVTSSASTGLRPRYGSVGQALPGVEIRLVADDGADVPVGDAGEILVRGPNVFKGYYRDEAATTRVLRDGWLHTGDVGMVDDDGWLYLVDRAKDLIIVSGFNVYPAEVEEVLVSHPAVAEAGVIGVAHPHTGEAVRAYVVLEDGCDIDEDALVDFACDHLARYKCPAKILFVDELPRNLSGKLLRRELDGTVLG